jgi:hypothetical protein
MKRSIIGKLSLGAALLGLYSCAPLEEKEPGLKENVESIVLADGAAERQDWKTPLLILGRRRIMGSSR